MSQTIPIDQLAAELTARLKEYADVTDEIMQEAIDAVGKEGRAELRSTSPKESGAYAKSWTFGVNRVKRNPHEYKRTIYAKGSHYRLTHLLEKGHDIKRNNVVVGHANAIAHIKPVDQMVQMELEKRVLEGIRKASQ